MLYSSHQPCGVGSLSSDNEEIEVGRGGKADNISPDMLHLIFY